MSYGKPHCYKTKIDELNREINELKNEAQLSDIAFDAVQEEIERLRNPWVSVGDRLPEVGGRFLIYDTFYVNKRDDTGHCIVMGRMSNSWGIAPNGFNGECPTVTHWMKLPEQPQ